MSTLSTHVLDTSIGRPAAGVAVLLERLRDAKGDAAIDQRDTHLGAGTTDKDGRLRDFVSAGASLGEGTYRLRFDVADYFARQLRSTFFPEVVIVFEIEAPNEHYHVPLLISPYGYSTYRGS
jgi:5-hydroxyisourate hydrolase